MNCKALVRELFSARGIDHSQKEELDKTIQDTDKADIILSAVMKGSYRHLEALKIALKATDQEHLAKLLP